MSEMEDTGDATGLVNLYADDATAGNILRPDEFEGREGVAEFWRRHRGQFEDMHSQYRVVSGDERGGVLEWTTTATSADHHVEFTGATVLDIHDGVIVRSMAYFDPASLGRQIVDGD